jgi:two-component system response regulator RegA
LLSLPSAADTATDATHLAQEEAPELALVDLRIGADNGLDLIRLLKEIDPATRIVVLAGYGSVTTAVEAMTRGVAHYLTKPADADEILGAFDGLSISDIARDLQSV